MVKPPSGDGAPAPSPVKNTPAAPVVAAAVAVFLTVIVAAVLWAPIQRAQLLVTVVTSVAGVTAVWAGRRRGSE